MNELRGRINDLNQEREMEELRDPNGQMSLSRECCNFKKL